jgi:putative serine protease PepD
MLHPLEVGDSSAVQVGDGVVAIGSPFGLQETVTSGIVSALHRSISSPASADQPSFTISDSIQTDAAINHGNSGGPLLNTSGQVIGITSQIKSDSRGNEGVGFAIPSNTIRSVVTQLIATGKAKHAYLGVRIDSNASNARIEGVPSGTPAADAGLKAGDVVTSLGGTKISTADDLASAINAHKPGDRVTVVYTRGGERHSVQLTLATRPS